MTMQQHHGANPNDSIDQARLTELAAVARIRLTEEETIIYTKELRRMLTALDGMRIPPEGPIADGLSGAVPAEHLREDACLPCTERELLLTAAAAHDGSCFFTVAANEEVGAGK